MTKTITFPQLEQDDGKEDLQAVIPEHLCVGGTTDPFLYGGSGFAACIAAMERLTGLPAIYATIQFVSMGRSGETIRFTLENVSGGNSIKQCRLAASIGGKPFATLMGAAGDRSDPTVHQGSHAPIVPPVDHCVERSVARQISSNLNDLFEFRMAKGQMPDRRDWRGEVGLDTAFWIRKRSALTLSKLDLSVIADLAAMALPSALGKPASGNSLDNMIRFIAEPDGEWVLSCTQVASVYRGITHINTQIYSESGNLLAVASQSMALRVRPPS